MLCCVVLCLSLVSIVFGLADWSTDVNFLTWFLWYPSSRFLRDRRRKLNQEDRKRENPLAGANDDDDDDDEDLNLIHEIEPEQERDPSLRESLTKRRDEAKSFLFRVRVVLGNEDFSKFLDRVRGFNTSGEPMVGADGGSTTPPETAGAARSTEFVYKTELEDRKARLEDLILTVKNILTKDLFKEFQKFLPEEGGM